MDTYLSNLISDVAQGNPGALTVVRELQWFSNWEKMLRYFLETGLTGGALWARCSDDYHLSFHDFGHSVDREMREHYGKQKGNKKQLLDLIEK